MTTAERLSRWRERQAERTEHFARQAMRHAGFQVLQRRGPHRVLLGPPECGHVLELHLYRNDATLLTLKVMTSVVFSAAAVPPAAALLLLEENDRLIYGSMRLLRYGTGRMLVHGVVLDTLVLSNAAVAGVISRALVQQTRDVIQRLMSHGLIQPGPLAVIEQADV